MQKILIVVNTDFGCVNMEDEKLRIPPACTVEIIPITSPFIVDEVLVKAIQWADKIYYLNQTKKYSIEIEVIFYRLCAAYGHIVTTLVKKED